MSIIDIISLFAVMVSLAIIPSTSVALVVTRSATLSIGNGVAVSIGIVVGDIVFILLAIFGLSVITETMGSLFLTIKYIGGSYLLWIGFQLLTSNHKTSIAVKQKNTQGSLVASFLAGLFLTLGDVKAIFFYVSLFPAFVNLGSLKLADIFIIILVTILTVGGVKVAYAFSARKVVTISRNFQLENSAKKIAGGFLMGAGSYLILKA